MFPSLNLKVSELDLCIPKLFLSSNTIKGSSYVMAFSILSTRASINEDLPKKIYGF